MDVQKLRYFFNDFGKLAAWIIVVILLGLSLYAYLTRDNDIFGKLPAPYFQNILTSRAAWDTSKMQLQSSDQEIVYKVKNRSITREQAWDLAGKLGLPAAGNITLDQNKEEQFYTKNSSAELSINLTAGSVHFKNSAAVENTVATSIAKKSQANSEAKKVIANLGINTKTYNLDKPEYEYYAVNKNSSHLQKVTEKEANIVYVAFPREIDTVAVVTVGGADTVSVGLNENNQVTSLNYQVLEIETPSEASYKVISAGQVGSKIREGKASLNRYLGESEVDSMPDQIKVGTGKIYYYNDKQTNFIQPIFVLEAAATSLGSVDKAEIYLRALQDTYFKK